MRRLYSDRLAALDEGLAALARLAATAVRRATSALVEAQLDLADAVVAGDVALDELYRSLDAQAFDLLATQQPVASDLRVVVASARIASDLERVGDYAVHLAKVARRKHPRHVLPDQARALVAEMGHRAAAVTDAAGDVVARRELDAATRVLDADDDIDRLHQQLLQLLLEHPQRFATDVVVDVTLVARYYERLADHAVSVARSVGYILTGEHAASWPASGADR